MTTVYVAGFLFTPDFNEVVLIEKQKPDFQKGLFNGVGGKFEPGRDRYLKSAMAREFQEETGAVVDESRWENFATWEIRKINTSIIFFAAVGGEAVESKEVEKVKRVRVAEISSLPTLKNVKWLVPAAIHALNDGAFAINVTDTAEANHG